MTLLTFMAIPSFVALCFLAIAHTLQTINLRLAESTPFPSEFSPELVAAAASLGVEQAAATRSTPRMRRFAFSKGSPSSFLPECRRSWPDFSSRILANLDAQQRPFAGRAPLPRRRMKLATPTRRPRPLSAAFAT
jgi:hypothetical protein